MASTALPEWLAATWSRNYIKRAAPDGTLGDEDLSVEVRYIQTAAEGHGFDLRIATNFGLTNATRIEELTQEQLEALAAPGAVECFAGITTSEIVEGNCTLSWHAAFLFPPDLEDGNTPEAVFASVAAGTHVTSDVGIAMPTIPTSRSRPVIRWLEHAPDASYEEEWVLLSEFFRQGAHLAARRPARSDSGACHLCILGNTFGFVRDINRAVLPSTVRNRPLASVLADETVSLAEKRQIMDCEFSFGFFGQGGSVGGVVERSSLPWRKGVALASLLGPVEEEGEWQPVRAADAGQLKAAFGAIRADHAKLCQSLRDALANGNVSAAELLKERGAIAG